MLDNPHDDDDDTMRSLALTLLTLPLLASNAVEAARFPRAVKGNGFLKVPVGTVDRPHKVKRDAIDTVLDNRKFFYATDSEYQTSLVYEPTHHLLYHERRT